MKDKARVILSVGVMAWVVAGCGESEPPQSPPQGVSGEVRGTRLDGTSPAPAPETVAKAAPDATEPSPPVSEPKATDPAPAAPANPPASETPAPSPAPSGSDDAAKKDPASDVAPDPEAPKSIHQKMDPAAVKKPQIEGFEGVTFAELGAFRYDEDKIDYKSLPAPVVVGQKANKIEVQTLAADKDPQMPEAIRKMQGKKIAVIGFMIPVDFRQGKTNEFVLTPIVPSCFFCQKPQLNEWMHVKTKDLKRVEYPGDGPITVWGTLSVGLQVEDGFPVNLFRMEAEGVKAIETEAK